jgi:hypothetical protein
MSDVKKPPSGGFSLLALWRLWLGKYPISQIKSDGSNWQ